MTIAIAAARTTALADEVNNPFVAWNNFGADPSVTLGGTAVLTGGERANAVTGSTYDKWRPDVTGANAYLSFDLGISVNVSFAAICAHNLSDFGGTVAVQKSVDGVEWGDAFGLEWITVGLWDDAIPTAEDTWTNITDNGSVTPTDNTPIAWRMPTAGTARRYWRFNFTGLTAGDLLSVGVAFIGTDLVIPRRFYQGFAPILTPTEVQLQSNVSVGNELLGSSEVGLGSTLEVEIANLPPEFVRGLNWLAFQRHFNSGGGAFFAWRPAKYPEDIHYIWRNGATIRPVNSGPRDLMSIRMEAQAHNA